MLVHTVKWLAETSEYRNSGPSKRRTHGKLRGRKVRHSAYRSASAGPASLHQGVSTGSELRLARASEPPDPPEMR